MSENSELSLQSGKTKPIIRETSKLAELHKDILTQLHPEKFTDQDDIEHAIWTFESKDKQPVKVVFYSPGELPFNEDIVRERQAFVMGESPVKDTTKFRTEDEWKDFVTKIRSASLSNTFPEAENSALRDQAVKTGKALFFVESTPDNIYRLSQHLGYENPQLAEGFNKAKMDKKANGTTQHVADLVIAGKLIADDGKIKK